MIAVDAMHATIRGFLVESFLFGQDGGKLSNHASLLEAGIIDSTGVLELIGFLETQFGIKVQDEEIVPENLDSIEKLVQYVEGKLTCN